MKTATFKGQQLERVPCLVFLPKLVSCFSLALVRVTFVLKKREDCLDPVFSQSMSS